jgi:hypothetical protein
MGNIVTKFDELCQAYATSRKNYFDYRDTCRDFINRLVKKTIKYLEIPEEQCKVIPLNQEVKDQCDYSISEAMHLDKDTFWHIGIQITLYEEPDIVPRQPVLIWLMIKKNDGSFLVKLGPTSQDFMIRPNEEEDYIHFIDTVFLSIKDSFELELQHFLEGEEKTRRIGFQ